MGLFGSSKKPPKLQFKPTNLTTEIGSASYDPTTGNVSSSLNPQLQAIKDLFWNNAMGFAPTDEQQAFASGVSDYGRGLFEQAANLDTGQMAQDYYNQVQAGLAPNRALEEARLGDTLFKTGRTGAGIGYPDSSGYINPEQFSMLKAREQANNSLFLGAEDRARGIQNQDIANAANYLNLGNSLQLQPYQNVAGITGMGTDIANLSTGLFAPLGQFSQLQQSWQGAKQQNDAARAAASGGGLFGGLAGGILGGASNIFGQGLGQMALSYFGGPWGAAASAAMGSMGGSTSGGSNYLGLDYGLGGSSYF